MDGYKAVSALKINNMIFYKNDIDQELLEVFKEHSSQVLFDQTPNTSSLYIKEGEFDKTQIIYLNEWVDYKTETLNDNTFEKRDFTRRGTFGTKTFGTIKFKNCIGLSNFKSVKLFVISPKITEDKFNHMLQVVNSYIANLSFDFNQTTFTGVERIKTLQSDVPYHLLTLLMYWFGTPRKDVNFYKVFNLIKSNPHRNIFDKYYYDDINNLSFVDEEILTDIFSNLDNLIETKNFNNKLASKLTKKGNQYLPQSIMQIETIDTYDTSENRFIKYFINYCIDILNSFIKVLIPKKDFLLNYTLIETCIYYKKSLSSLIDDTFLRNVRKMSYIPANSSVLQRREGYRQFYNYYITLKSMPKTNLDNDALCEIIENKNLDVLYEYYCFFTVTSILCHIYGTNINNLNFKLDKDEFSNSLSKKSYHNYFEFVNSSQVLPKVKLFYNKNYGFPESYSKSFDPDITLEVFDSNDELINIIVFDAKFKFNIYTSQSTDEQSEKLYKYDDISKMHTYKDAINSVLGAFVLYPGDKHKIYTENPFCKDCQRHTCKESFRGVGAYPLNPGDDTDIIALTISIKEMLHCCI